MKICVFDVFQLFIFINVYFRGDNAFYFIQPSYDDKYNNKSVVA